AELAHETDELSAVTGSLCEDSVLDQTLVGMRAGTLETGDRLKLSVRADKLKKAHRFDELVLVTGRGEILGGGPVGTIDPTIVATLSREPFLQATGQLDRVVLVLGVACFAGGLVLAFIFSKQLAEPIESLSEQARRVVAGDPVPIKAHGGRELEEFARSFNR